MSSVFMSYSHADEAMRDRLETHLALLKREGIIQTWHDRRIVPGARLDGSIMAEAETADIFLFLLSADFLASRYCYEIEMARALEREEAGEAAILPVVLHSCEWLHSDLGKFTAVPKDGKPIAKHSYPEDAYVEVASAIRRLVSERQKRTRKATTSAPAPGASGADARRVDPVEVVRKAPPPRSSNLAIRKEFSDADRHAFLEEGFEFIAKFFEESLAELGRRNPGVDGRYRRNGADTFTARVFMQGKQEAQCRVLLGGIFGNGISFSHDADARIGSSNEQLTVKTGDQELAFDALMGAVSGRSGKGMSSQGAAEHLWSMFIEPLQRRRR
jgi:hypothetical protein